MYSVCDFKRPPCGVSEMMPAMAGLLSLERREEVAVVTLQRPEKRNALSIDLRVELTDAFGALGEDPGSARSSSPEPRRPSAREWTRRVRRRPRPQGAAGRDQHRLLPRGRRLPQAGGGGGQRTGAGRWLRARAALRSASGRRGRRASASPSCRAGYRRATRPREPPCPRRSQPSSRSRAGCSTPRARCAWGSSAPSTRPTS